MAATVTRLTCRSRWPTIICRSYSTALAQHPKTKPAPLASSSKPKPKRAPESTSPKKTTSDADSIEGQLKALDQMRRMPSVYTSTDFWGSPMASFGLYTRCRCLPTLTQQIADVQIPYDIRAMVKTLLTQRPYEIRKVKDIWFAIKYNSNNWLKNTFG